MFTEFFFLQTVNQVIVECATYRNNWFMIFLKITAIKPCQKQKIQQVELGKNEKGSYGFWLLFCQLQLMTGIKLLCSSALDKTHIYNEYTYPKCPHIKAAQNSSS